MITYTNCTPLSVITIMKEPVFFSSKSCRQNLDRITDWTTDRIADRITFRITEEKKSFKEKKIGYKIIKNIKTENKSGKLKYVK